jgi:hypothetical protein
MTAMSDENRSVTQASWLPSGDHSGSLSANGSFVIWVSAFVVMSKMNRSRRPPLSPEKAICWPLTRLLLVRVFQGIIGMI